ncbi:Methyltransferase type [Parasponia andersonii]|uniref:Methyltransferase type n=1 Tax=Parasponia andersonii TaxID=3476 RepID=A0A2P5B0Q7_PARAD|nr:Methyltransferase type [Parasponia andersonii]
MKSSTNHNQTKQRAIAKYFLLSLFLSLPLFVFLLSLRPGLRRITTPAPIPTKPEFAPNGLRIRPGYSSYENYIQRQLNKTLNPKLRQIWTTRDWERKIRVFSQFFQDLKRQSLLSNDTRALCIGARVGQEVEALRRIGVSNSVGIDLVPYPPLVLQGDFHNQPFRNGSLGFEFSNVFDHALFPEKFVAEIERTLKPGGVCVLHVSISKRADKYSANDLYSAEPLVRLFRSSDLVHVRKIDGFGLDTELVFRKRELI